MLSMKSNRPCTQLFAGWLLLAGLLAPQFGVAQSRQAPAKVGTRSANVFPIEEGFVDANGVMIYYQIIGRGEPLMIIHGGPGASHDYFLPYLLPLARDNQVIFIDERGSGRSQKLDNPSGYTVENMVEDIEAVRQSLGLGKIISDGPLVWRCAGAGLRA